MSGGKLCFGGNLPIGKRGFCDKQTSTGKAFWEILIVRDHGGCGEENGFNWNCLIWRKETKFSFKMRLGEGND